MDLILLTIVDDPLEAEIRCIEQSLPRDMGRKPGRQQKPWVCTMHHVIMDIAILALHQAIVFTQQDFCTACGTWLLDCKFHFIRLQPFSALITKHGLGQVLGVTFPAHTYTRLLPCFLPALRTEFGVGRKIFATVATLTDNNLLMATCRAKSRISRNLS